MTLIANHAAINARVIGANEDESHYIFDLLMSNTLHYSGCALNRYPWGEPCELRVTGFVAYQFARRYARGKAINDMFDVKEDK